MCRAVAFFAAFDSGRPGGAGAWNERLKRVARHQGKARGRYPSFRMQPVEYKENEGVRQRAGTNPDPGRRQGGAAGGQMYRVWGLELWARGRGNLIQFLMGLPRNGNGRD